MLKIVHIITHMKATQFMLNSEDIRALSSVAKTLKLSRSEVVRRAIRRFVEAERSRALELQMKRAYERMPQKPVESSRWEKIQAWPND